MGVPAAIPGRVDQTPKPLREIETNVEKVLRETPHLPPITWSNWYKEVRWFNASVIFLTPLLGLYGGLTTPLLWQTFLLATAMLTFGLLGV